MIVVLKRTQFTPSVFSAQKYFKFHYPQNKKCTTYTKNVVKHIFDKKPVDMLTKSGIYFFLKSLNR